MDGFLTFLIFAGLFYFMMRFGCGAHIVLEHDGQEYTLCCPVCQAEFERHPEKYLR